MNEHTRGCPLLATDKIHTVRQRKTAPDAKEPQWKHWFRKRIFLPLVTICFDLMNVALPEFKDGSWSEGQQSFTDRADAEELMLSKGPGWYIESTPLNGCLPNDSCTFDDEPFPVGREATFRNGNKKLPVAVLPGHLEVGQQQLQSMLDQTERMLKKNRAASG